jgi:lipopolysaccharide export system permease protein
MRILDWYVLKTFIKNYLISLMVLVGMYIVLDMVFNFGDLVDVRGANEQASVQSVVDTIRDIADYYSYQFFLIFEHMSGVIPVVAAAFTLLRLSRFNELTAILAAGVPLLRVAVPIILAGVAVNVLMVADQEVLIPSVIPQLTRKHDEMHVREARTFEIQAMQDNDKALLYCARYTPPIGKQPALMECVDVIERQERQIDGVDGKPPRKVIEPKAHILADSGVWNAAEGRWDLTKGQRIELVGDEEQQPEPRPCAFYKSNITPEEVALYRSGDWVELLSTSRIDMLIARPGNYGQANLLRVKHWRFVQPFMNVVLLLLAIPCVLTREPGHLKSAATRCLILTGIGMGSMFLSHQLAGSPPPGADWAVTWPALMAWMPVLIFGPVAVFLLDRVKT